MKKFIAMLLALAMVLSLAACGSYNRSEISPDMPVFRHVSGKIFPSESFSRPLCLRVPALPNRSTPKRLKDIERITALCSVTLS